MFKMESFISHQQLGINDYDEGRFLSVIQCFKAVFALSKAYYCHFEDCSRFVLEAPYSDVKISRLAVYLRQ